MGVISTRAPARGEGTAQEEKVSGPVQEWSCPGGIALLGPWSISHPIFLSGPVLAVVATVLIKQVEEAVDVLWGLQHQWDCLIQEVEKAEKEWEHISNWVGDLFDERPDVREEIWTMEQELKQLRAEKEIGSLWSRILAQLHPAVFQGSHYPRVLQLIQGHPRKGVNNNPEGNLACHQNRGRSTISHA